MNNEIKSITPATNQMSKKSWTIPTVEVIGRNVIESGHTESPIEGKQPVSSLHASYIYGNGIIS